LLEDVTDGRVKRLLVVTPVREQHERDGRTGNGSVWSFAASCPAVDFSTWEYDSVRQIAMVHDGDHIIEAAKHSTGPTQTPTNTDNGTRYERDDDITED
jgi:putative ATP-grasp target RiPP